MAKGFNTAVMETRKSITDAINNGLQQGVPISVINIIVDSALFEIRTGLDKVLKEEASENEPVANSDQIEWVEPSEDTMA